MRFTIFPPVLKKLGEVNTLKVGLVSFAVIFFLIGFVNHPIQFVILLILISFAASMTRGPFNSLLTQSVSPKEQGKINGYSSSLDSVGQICGPTLGGLFLWLFPTFWLGMLTGTIATVSFIMIFNAALYKRVLSSRKHGSPKPDH